MKDGTHKALLGIEKKPLKMEDDKWNDINFRAKATIILCISHEVLYNVMNKETTVGLVCARSDHPGERYIYILA